MLDIRKFVSFFLDIQWLSHSQVKLGTSEPIVSVEFRRFLDYRIRVQISSDEFRSVPTGSVDFRRISGRNFAELTGIFPTKSGPESCSQEIVGIQRSRPKINGICRIRCRKRKKTTGSDGRNSGPGLFLESLFALYRDNITSEQDKLIIAAHWALLRSGYSSMSNGKVGKTFSILYFIQ